MESDESLEHRTAVRLLCYLTVSELVSFTITRRWLTPARLVSSVRLWLLRNDLSLGWQHRVRLAQLAATVARRIDARGEGPVDLAEARSLLTQNMSVDYESPLVERVMRSCATALRGLSPDSND
jgi:hypothetical protein